ncbi:AAA family ATPase [Anaerobutyricum hallii]|uniref:AAA family ATPase n=1 Tax=Anaerobutyricum hallii TaxID=39488 RepID=UPI0026759B21|nr:AAA family ATPase [Anaerobutyricum hallii]
MLNQEQKKALDIMLSGGNVFLSGGAGTGKSYLIRSFLKAVTNKKRKKCFYVLPQE